MAKPIRTPVLDDKPLRTPVLEDPSPKKPNVCIFCGSDSFGKTFAEGCEVDDRSGSRVIVWRYRGICHEKCRVEAHAKARKDLGL